MNKEELLKKITGKLGVSNSEAELAFEIFIDKISSIIEVGETVKVEGIGYFQLKKFSKKEGEKRISEKIIYAPDEEEVIDNDNLFLSFDVTGKRKNKFDFDDSIFSLSAGKPIIPVTDAAKEKYELDSSFLMVKKAVEEKVEQILNKADVLKNFDIVEDYIGSKTASTSELEEIEETPEETIGDSVDFENIEEQEENINIVTEPRDEEHTALEEESFPDAGVIEEEIEELETFSDGESDFEEMLPQSEFENLNPEPEEVSVNEEEMESDFESFPEEEVQTDTEIAHEISELDNIEEENAENEEQVTSLEDSPADDSLDADLEAIKAMAGDSFTDELDDLDDDLSGLDDFFGDDTKEEETTIADEIQVEDLIEETEQEPEQDSERGILEDDDVDIESVLDETISEVIDNSDEKNDIRDDGIIPDEFDLGVKEKEEDDEWDWGDELKSEIESIEEEDDELKDEEDVDDLFEHLGDSVDETLGENETEEEAIPVQDDDSEDETPLKNESDEVEEETIKEKTDEKSKLSFNLQKILPSFKLKLGKLFWIIFSSFVLVTFAGVYFLFFIKGSDKKMAEVPLVQPDYSVKLVEPEMDIIGEPPALQSDKKTSVKEKKSEPEKHKSSNKKESTKPENKSHQVKKTETKSLKNSTKPIKILNENDLKKVGKFIFTDGILYSVQIASFKSKKITEREVKKLRSKGYDAFIVKAYLKFLGGTWYRINIGGFKSKAEAEKFQKSYK